MRRQIGGLLVGTPSGQQIPLSALADIHEAGGASFIYRENNSRYIGVQYSVEGRDLESAVPPASGPLPTSKVPASRATGSPGVANTTSSSPPSSRCFIGPMAVLIIFMILFALYDNFKFPIIIALGVILTVPVGALLALKLTHTPFSASSALGMLALMGVSVETAVILVSYINKLRTWRTWIFARRRARHRCCGCGPS